MSSLEKYILSKYGRFVPFKDCSEELQFDVSLALDASIKKDCIAAKVIKPNATGEITYGLTPRLISVEYMTERFCIANESIDFKNGGLLYSALARLLNLNMHLEKESVC